MQSNAHPVRIYPDLKSDLSKNVYPIVGACPFPQGFLPTIHIRLGRCWGHQSGCAWCAPGIVVDWDPAKELKSRQYHSAELLFEDQKTVFSSFMRSLIVSCSLIS